MCFDDNELHNCVFIFLGYCLSFSRCRWTFERCLHALVAHRNTQNTACDKAILLKTIV